MARGPSGESVLQRAIRVFESFTSDDPALRVTDLARRAGLPLATASRLVAELVELGVLTRLDDGRVRMGTRLWELAVRASPALTLREAAMPVMENLHGQIGQHTQLGILDGTEVLFVERLSAPRAVINYTRIAGRLPAHASSSGLVLLAHAPAELLERILSAPLRGYTPETITAPARLRIVLADVRRSGFALCAGHIHPDATGIAVPVRDAADTVVAALAVIIPSGPDALARIPVLKAAARSISRRLAQLPRTDSGTGRDS